MNKKVVLGGFAAAAAFLMMSSAAFACTTFKGHMVVTGDASGVSSTVDGNNAGMGYCAGTLLPGAQSHSTAGATVTVGEPSAASCNGSTFTPSKSYTAYFLDGKVFGNAKVQGQLVYSRLLDCMRGSTGTNNIGSAGTTTTGGILANTVHTLVNNSGLNVTGQDSGVCLTQDDALIGNQAPLHIVV